MVEIKGKYNTAKVFINDVDDGVRKQITNVCDLDFFAGCKIRVMPDTHQGKGCTIGTTMTIKNKIIPNMVGVDIGCGMETAILDDKDIDFDKLDGFIRSNIPSGTEVRKEPHDYCQRIRLTDLRCFDRINGHRAVRSIGTLGGGNHFIEVDRDDEGTTYIVIHSGSRHLGNEVALWYQGEGYRSLSGSGRRQLRELIETLKAEGREKEIEKAMRDAKNSRSAKGMAPEFAYVEGALFDDYIHDMKLTQDFALLNRKAMLDDIVCGMKLTVRDTVSTIHNYIDTDRMILRKGAVSANKGETLLIPINMRDGALLCVGKGNEDWNFSAPHGAGRLMSRKAAERAFTLDEFRDSMRGIYTTSVGRRTLDECPMAYKDMSAIVDNIGPTAEIKKIIRPVYNFKAG